MRLRLERFHSKGVWPGRIVCDAFHGFIASFALDLWCLKECF